MKDFGDAERRILAFMRPGTEFMLCGKRHKVILSGKPTCYDGEPKTDVYILAESVNRQIEIKISYKKENADFIENKINEERAEQLFGPNWGQFIECATTAIGDRFNDRILIYQNRFKKTERGAITLGWKFELMNKSSGDLSGRMFLTREQVLDVYAGSHLSEDKRNAWVGQERIRNSGVANCILMDEKVSSAQDIINRMVPIQKYVQMHPEVYFACKALNYRTFKKKWDGNRPLAVSVYWTTEHGRLTPRLVFDRPLQVKGNAMAERLRESMKMLNIKNTDDITAYNAGTDRKI